MFTSLSAARSLLEQKGQRPLLLVEESALEDFTGGFQLLQLPAEPAGRHPAVSSECRDRHVGPKRRGGRSRSRLLQLPEAQPGLQVVHTSALFLLHRCLFCIFISWL